MSEGWWWSSVLEDLYNARIPFSNVTRKRLSWRYVSSWYIKETQRRFVSDSSTHCKLSKGSLFLLCEGWQNPSFTYLQFFPNLIKNGVHILVMHPRPAFTNAFARRPPFILYGTTVPQWARASSFMRFLDHTQRRTTVGRTSLDEWSARRRDLFMATHNTRNRQTSPSPVRFEPIFSAGERPQTHALDGAASGAGREPRWSSKNIHGSPHLVHGYTDCPKDRCFILKICIWYLNLDSYQYIPAAHVTVHCKIWLIKLTVFRFVGTGGFLIRYANGHTN
jgi:hypothetical protein